MDLLGCQSAGILEVRAAEVRAAEVRVDEGRAAEVRAAEVRAAEVGVDEGRAAESLNSPRVPSLEACRRRPITSARVTTGTGVRNPSQEGMLLMSML